MDTRRAVRIAALVVLLCFVLALAVEYADAAPAKAGKAKGDQSLAQKKGIAGSLGTKKTDETKKATKLQMMIGVGSLFVAFAVIKWL
jgi:hypothetical protein